MIPLNFYVVQIDFRLVMIFTEKFTCERYIKIIKKEISYVMTRRINGGIAHIQKKKSAYAIIVDIKIPLSERQFSDMSYK